MRTRQRGRSPLRRAPMRDTRLGREQQTLVLKGVANHHVSPTMCRYVEQRTGFKLGKFRRSIEHVMIRLGAGPRPSCEERAGCQIEVCLLGIGDIVVHDSGGTARTAFDRAADRVERAVRRRLQRTRDNRHAIRVGRALRRGQLRRRRANHRRGNRP